MRDLIPVSELPPGKGLFQDANFKLAALDALLAKQVLEFGGFIDFLKFIEGPGYNYDRDGYELSPKAYDYLRRYPLTEQHTAAITDLYFDGGLDIYRYAYPFWGGETEDFDIQNLVDVSLLPNLQTFGFSAMLNSTDLSPLAGHPNLETLELGLTGTWRNFEVVEGLPKLRYLQVFGHDLDDSSEASISRLLQRGVGVEVF